MNEPGTFCKTTMSKDGTQPKSYVGTMGGEAAHAGAAINVSIIVISYNTCALLRDCLNSVHEKTSGLSYEIIVVDNASIDTSCEMLENEFPDILLIRNRENLGFARANNQAIEKSRGQYVFLLNSDTVLENNAIGIMHDFMQAHPRAAVCGPLLLNADKTVQRSIEAHFTVTSMILRLTLGLALNHAPRPFRDKYHTDSFPYSTRCRITDGWLTGAVMMIRKQVFPEVGVLDEAYHFYNEDADWGLAVSRSGWETWFVPEAVVMHLLGSSCTEFSREQEIAFKIRFLRHNRYYVLKNLGLVRYCLYRFIVFWCGVANLACRVIMAAVSSPEKRVHAIFRIRLGWQLLLASMEIGGSKTSGVRR